MVNGFITNASGSGSKEEFLQALKNALSDLYDKERSTTIHKLYETLATQLADVDIEIERALHDLFLSAVKTNERVQRGFTSDDRLAEEGGFRINYLGFVPDNTLFEQVNVLTPADTEVVLERLPKDDNADTVRVFNSDNEEVTDLLVLDYNEGLNTLRVYNIPKTDQYRFTYIDKGCTLYKSEIVAVTKTSEGRIQGQVAFGDVLFDSERITLQNSGVGVFQRDEDYTFDYVTGTFTSIEDGLIEQLDPEELDISYRSCFDFNSETVNGFHRQIFNEQVPIVGNSAVRAANTNISEVFRLFNTTTQEQYEVTEISDNIVKFTGDLLPRIERNRNQALQGQYVNTSGPDRLQINLVHTVDLPNDVYQIELIRDVTTVSDWIRLIQGGRESVPRVINLRVPYEVGTLELYTGTRSKETSHVRLLANRDYTLLTDQLGIATITFLDSGLEKIGQNNLYASYTNRLTPFNENRVNNTAYNFSALITTPRDEITFDQRTVVLSNAVTYVMPSQNGDVRVGENLIVATLDGETVFEENLDYTYDGVNKILALTANSAIREGDTVAVFYGGRDNYFVDYEYTPDLLVMDYDITKNSVDWTPSLEPANVVMTTFITDTTNRLQLPLHPQDILDFNGLEIFLRDDRAITLRPIKYDPKNRSLLIEAPEISGHYVTAYQAYEHKIDPNVPYFVSYNYGARDRSLKDVWAPLIDLTITSRRRDEIQPLAGGQDQVVLNFPPLSIDSIAIYLEGNTSDDIEAIPTGFDPSTNTLSFTPVRAFGNYVFSYETEGALTEDLRTAIIALIKAFLAGPTQVAIEELIEAFTGITPLVRPATALGFRIAEEGIEDPALRSDRLNDVGFTGEGIEFSPARFATGLDSDPARGTIVQAPAGTNVRYDRGTIEFLVGPKFNGDDNNSYYFVDVGTPNQPYNSRISIHKNKRNYLVVEIFDEDGEVYRVASNVGRGRTTLTKFLEAGTTSTELEVRPTFATTDLDNDGQFDLFGAEPTELTIKRVVGDPVDDGYGYGQLPTTDGYGYGQLPPNGGTTVPFFGPVNIAVLFQIRDYPEYQTQVGFDRVSQRLLSVANAVAAAGGLLSVHTSVSYLQSNQAYSNVLKSLQDAGHEVGLYVDAPSYLESKLEKVQYLQNGIAIAQELELDIQVCSPNNKMNDWAQIITDLDLEITAGYEDPFFKKGFEDPSPAIRRIAQSSTLGALDLAGGQLGYLPGTTDLQVSLPLSRASLQQYEATLHRAVKLNEINTTSSWYLSLEAEELTDDYLQESAYIQEWIENVVTALQEQGLVRWNKFIDSFALFRAIEQWTQEQDAKTQNILNRDACVKPLKYDFDSNTLTFESIPADGLYTIDYVTGWAAYEESEIYVALVYKLHTEDGALPFYKLYINGELQEFITFGDFPPPSNAS